MTKGATQSAIDLPFKTARDPQKALQLSQFPVPLPGCCFSPNHMLAVIMSGCAAGVAPPTVIKLLLFSENRAWNWPCELDSHCLSSRKCHPNKIMVLPNPDLPCDILYYDSDEVPHRLAPESPRSRHISAMEEPPTMYSPVGDTTRLTFARL